MYNVPGARMSPEVVAGVIRFCHGDTFTIHFTLELRDQDGTPVEISNTDHVTFEVFDRSHKTVFTQDVTNLSNNTFKWYVNEVTSNKMLPGWYTYRVSVEHGGQWTTVALENKIHVR